MLIILLLLKTLRPILKLQSLKLTIELELLSARIFLVKVIQEIGQLVIDSVLKTNPWTYKFKDLNGEKIIGSFYEKEFLSSIL